MRDLVELTRDEISQVGGGFDDGSHPSGGFIEWMKSKVWGAADDDGDGVPNHSDRMRGGDDRAFHLHGSDGTIMGQNPDGSFTLYDQNGTPALQKWDLTGVTQDTGASGSVSGSTTGGTVAYSTDGNTYTFTRR
jgi:hypothetical protein